MFGLNKKEKHTMKRMLYSIESLLFYQIVLSCLIFAGLLKLSGVTGIGNLFLLLAGILLIVGVVKLNSHAKEYELK